MAQTWPTNRRRAVLLASVDVIARPLAALVRSLGPGRRARNPPQRILVIEPWHIGDLVLATPLLGCLRANWPQAHISILAKPFAQHILRHSGLVDDIISADLPWTARRNKYPVSPKAIYGLLALCRDLRKRNFDLTIDARMDIRSNVLAAATGAPTRLGYSLGGGRWLLTKSPANNLGDAHRIEDWLTLLSLAGGEQSRCSRSPRLTVAREEQEAALVTLSRAGGGKPIIAYHPGGSHPGKRWPLERFQRLASTLEQQYGGNHVVFLGPDDEGEAAGWPTTVTILRPTIRELMALLACCDLLVCNDSGPMHLADALGTPVVAVFEVGNPQWYGPSGEKAVIVAGERAGTGISAKPIETPPPNPVPVDNVLAAVHSVLTRPAVS